MSGPAAIGVVIAAYNAEASLADAIASLTSQTWRDWQAIVVDDGSTDETAEIARRAVARDERVEFLAIPHTGVSGARNAGLARLRTEWVMFLDSDDTVERQFMQTLLAQADATTDAVYCAYRRVTPNGAVVGDYFEPAVGEDAFAVLARRPALAIHSVLLRTAKAQALGGFDPHLGSCEDWDLWQRLARAGASFRGIPVPLAIYNMHAGSLSGRHAAMLQDGLRVLQRGHGPDARVASPAPAHRNGVTGGGYSERASFMALWCAAAELGAGRDGGALLETLDAPLRLGPDMSYAAETIVDGAAIGARATHSAVARRLSAEQAPLRGFLQAVAAALPPAESGPATAQLERALFQRLPRNDEIERASLVALRRAAAEVGAERVGAKI
ncbi:MAG: glycosyltransferase family 2 protein, partial [Caulobacteraceae bacterium]|nr:glycosyltransferase family 2 protein [Caulobacteraceae bacterium]